ncbi:hydroxysqualene dehydroxylase HpnE [Alicyclobacillus tolerans]|uniref:Squalene-associated FAD-dependent desaturase n=1 Tax=Alicyclobacillus tolerans TaxID=90970 RepID=A0A1M6NLU0_9BACL|nr:hydroxysqualene dehydroxylase HpnE [Alicyclobacillus montanus]SHJ96669.1 squalene-associated FAD-dependent desaturase [Alicyclobacillus montanus]
MATQNGINRHILIIGAGFSGLAAAWQLSETVDQDVSITLVDSRPYAGGRAFSFIDSNGLHHLDNGQHILLGCCNRFLEFLAAMGMPEAVRFQPLLRVPVYCQGRWSTISSLSLPGIFHLLPTLTNYRHLSFRERLQMINMIRALEENPNEMEDISFFEWLRMHGQSERSIHRLWDLVGVSVLNTRAEHASARQAIRAFQTGIINGWKAARLGFFQVPLGDIGRQAVCALRKRDVTIRLNCPVQSLIVRNDIVEGVQFKDGSYQQADDIIAALPPDALLRVLPENIRSISYFHELHHLSWSPIVNVYLHFNRPIIKGDVIAFAEGVCQFLFNRGRLLGIAEEDGKLIGVSISAADHLRQVTADNLIEMVIHELCSAVPEARDATLISAKVVWQPQATFLQSVGTGAFRRSSQTPVKGLWLAGDWTDTGWPACLEGAVRSGESAARAVSQSFFEENGSQN